MAREFGGEVTGIVARSCSHGHTGGVSSVQKACNATSRSASADMRVGASTSMRESGSASGSVDAGMQACGMRVLVLRHGVATTTLTYTRMQAQGGSRKMQRALLAEASISGPWREVTDRMHGSVQKQSGAICVGARECPGPRHGCTHGQARSRRWHAWARYGSRRWGALAQARARARARHGMPQRRAWHHLAASRPRPWHGVTVETQACEHRWECPRKFQKQPGRSG
ncbi:hypothetical protein SLEP1_g4367 [Rubroshorea leprosula]|uniref:Uncharacterized protein n=1 Tax=Rubroshorea leprosula TaxID=152421 RepID=A0AAV5HY81_9ROSI|nr:hypothetical protein SLEP1_g4367 [Rubroshorea leprosula]